MVELLRWDSKVLDSQVSSLAFPCKKGKGKAKNLKLQPVFSHLVGLTNLENKASVLGEPFLTHLFIV